MATVNSWNNDVDSASITFNGGTMSIGTDATNNTYNFATGSAVKTVVVGSTNGASKMTLNTGTGDFLLASASGNIMTAKHAGSINYPLKSSFLAYLGSNVTNATGNAASFTLGTTTALTKVFDQNSDFNTNGTFTAPTTGIYRLSASAGITACTIATELQVEIVTTAHTFDIKLIRAATANDYNNTITVLASMTAADTATCVIIGSGEAGNTDSILGSSGGVNPTFFCGHLAC